MSIQRGIVKFFDARAGKLFGFMFVLDENGKPTKEEVFFHHGDSCHPTQTPHGVDFGPHLAQVTGGAIKAVRYPKKGDILVFMDTPTPKGPKAFMWARASHWDHLEQIFRSRQACRIVELKCKGAGSEAEPERRVIWQGPSFDKIHIEFPISAFPSLDPRCDAELWEGCNLLHYAFEQLVDGKWTQVIDPRLVVTPA